MADTTGRVPFAAAADHSLPMTYTRPLAANVSPARGWLTGQNASGYLVSISAGPNLIPMGVADRDADGSATAGAAKADVRWCFVHGIAASTVSGDGFAATDFGIPAWGVDNQTIGKKSNVSGTNRGLAGLVFGLHADDSTPWLWTGPVAGLVARATMITDSFAGAHYQIADAAANTATTERAIPREKVHGVVTAIEFIGAAVATDATDYVTITVSKRDGAGGTAVTLGTFTTNATGGTAIAAFTPAAFTPSATAADLNLLETDIVTITVAKAGAGKTLTGAVRLIQKVQ